MSWEQSEGRSPSNGLHTPRPAPSGTLRHPIRSPLAERVITHRDRLVVHRRGGDEPIRVDGEVAATLRDFWSWACSDLSNNTMRGVLAEYLVAMALGAAGGTRTEWDAVDIRTAEQWRIEVKSAAYVQSWAQSKPSEISFSIAPATGWDAQTDLTPADVLRPSDVYVFCLLHHLDKQTLDPLDLCQWTFYVLSTKVLDDRCPGQKTIRLSSLERLHPVHTDFSGLGDAVAACADDHIQCLEDPPATLALGPFGSQPARQALAAPRQGNQEHRTSDQGKRQLQRKAGPGPLTRFRGRPVRPGRGGGPVGGGRGRCPGV